MNVHEAAEYLCVARQTIYNWKSRAMRNNGYLIFNGRAVRFRYRQTGAVGQGKISFETSWLDEIKQAMEGTMASAVKLPTPELANIYVELGTPR